MEISPEMQSHLDDNISPFSGLQAEVCNLWTQPRLHLDVHLVTGLHQLHCQIHVVPRQAVVDTQRQGSRQEAD